MQVGRHGVGKATVAAAPRLDPAAGPRDASVLQQVRLLAVRQMLCHRRRARSIGGLGRPTGDAFCRRYGEAVRELSICMAFAPEEEVEVLEPFVERLHLLRLESSWKPIGGRHVSP